MTWASPASPASPSHFRHPWFVSKRKRCETPVDDLDASIVAKRRRQCSTLEHGFAYLSIGNLTTMEVPWTNDSCSSSPVNLSAMDSDMLPPQPIYTVEEPVPEVDMKASSWYEPEPDSKNYMAHLCPYRLLKQLWRLIRNSDHRFGFVYRVR